MLRKICCFKEKCLISTLWFTLNITSCLIEGLFYQTLSILQKNKMSLKQWFKIVTIVQCICKCDIKLMVMCYAYMDSTNKVLRSNYSDSDWLK